MQLQNSFTVPVPVDRAWDTLLDVERIASCLPGAVLDASDGATYRGRVKVKVGPIQLAYGGTASIVEQDEQARRLVLEASGKESRGSGSASAKVVASLVDKGGETDVLVATDLDLTGRPAQFGRSVISDVSGRLIGQFATNLATLLTAPEAPAVEAATQPAARPEAAPAAAAPAGTALDVWTLVPAPVRVGLRVVAPALLLFSLGWLAGRRR